MKKIISLLLAICLLPLAAAADTCSAKLVPTFPSNQATLICSTFSAGTIGTLANNTYAVARNAANDANINVWKVDATDDTVLNADTGDIIKLSVAGTSEVTIDNDLVSFTGNAGVIAAPTSVAVAVGAVTEVTFGNDKQTFSGNAAVVVAPTSIAFAALDTTPIARVDSAGLTVISGNTTMTAGDTVYSTAGKQPSFPAAAIITPSTSFPTPAAGDTLTQRLTIVAAGAPTATFVELPLATAVIGKTFTVFNQSSNPAAIVPISGNTQGVAVAATPFACTTLKSCDCTALSSTNWMCGVR